MMGRALNAALLTICAASVVLAEKGDTYTAIMNGKILPPNSGWVAPPGRVGKQEVPFSLNDNGIKSTVQGDKSQYTFEVSIPSETFPWEKVSLINTKLPGSPIIFDLITRDQAIDPIFVYGNYSLGELDDALKKNGLDVNALRDNSTYVVTVVNEANKTALGDVLLYNPVATFGEFGFGNDTAGTQSELQSNLVYLATIDNSTTGFEKGFTNGYKPTSGNGVIIMQELDNGTFTWELDSSFIQNPASLQMRHFNTLGYQPLLMDLPPDVSWEQAFSEQDAGNAVYTGQFNKTDLVNALSSIGLDYNKVNFNTTPSELMLCLTDASNGTILGFVYNAFEAPPPPPVIKGAAARATGSILSATMAALVTFWLI